MSVDYSTDAGLLARVRQGDCRAYLDLFDRYYNRIEEYAKCVLQDETAAAAAAGATFQCGFREARRSRSGRRNYPAYLFVLCRRQLLRHLPREGARRHILRPGAPGTGLQVGPGEVEELPLSIILYRERDTLIQHMLDGLDVEDRELIHFAFEPGVSRESVRMILKQPSDEALTAKLVRALRRLETAVLQAGYTTLATAGSRSDGVKRRVRV
jgi:DNA-directed RNA polymerase specialized sigma24 family protein